MSQLIIGLTGGIATGKSTVSKQFKQLGVQIVDADLIARQVVEPGSNALIEIAKHFGEDILNSDHSLNRAKLREIIFADNAAKAWLNNLLHPIIRLELTEQLKAATSPYVVLDAPLLFENKLDAICRFSVLVDIPEKLQIARATQRDNVTAQQIQNIIDAQMPTAQKRKKADYIIDNSNTLDKTIEQVNTLHRTFILKAKH